MSHCSGCGLVWKAERRILSLAEAAFDGHFGYEPPLPTKLGEPQNRYCDSPVILQSSGPPLPTLSGLRFGPRENQARGNRSRRQYELSPAANSDPQNANLPRARYRNQPVRIWNTALRDKVRQYLSGIRRWIRFIAVCPQLFAGEVLRVNLREWGYKSSEDSASRFEQRLSSQIISVGQNAKPLWSPL
jgi:hypothetical protein